MEGHLAGRGRLDHEEAAVERVPATVLDRRREDIQHRRPVAVQVVEDRAAPEVVFNAGEDVRPDRLEQRVAGRDPFEGRVGREDRLVEGDLAVLPAESAEPRLLAVTNWDEVPRHLADAVGAAVRAGRLRLQPGLGRRRDEELLDHLGHEPPLLSLGRLPHDRRQVEFPLGQPFEGALGDGPEPVRADVLDDAGLDLVLVGEPGVHVAEQLLQ